MSLTEKRMGRARYIFLIVSVAMTCVLAASAQVNSSAAAKIRSGIQKLAARSGKATILTRRLVVYSGKVAAAGEDSFSLKIKKRISALKYADVLEFSGGGERLSIAPELTKKSHGEWEDVNKVFPGTKILIVTDDGKVIKGLSNSATSELVVFIERGHHERMDVARDRVNAVYGLVGGYGGVKKGASKGSEGMTTGRDQLLDGVFAGVGALVGLVKSDGRPILIYSK